ncbi:MAG: GNAT family N-acetyltransferase [Candidatus Berkiella sp.]
MNLNIAYLADYPAHLTLLAEWMFTTWGHYNPGSSIERIQSKLADHLKRDSLPITLIALDNNRPVGTCSLRINDGIRPDLTPWLASLFVLPEYRGQGVGEKLIDAITQEARRLHFTKLYLLAFDPILPNWYQRLGWQGIGIDELHGNTVSVMEKSI